MEQSQELNTNLRQEISFAKDLLSIFTSLVIGLFLLILSNILLADTNIIFVIIGLIVIFYGITILVRVFNDFGSAMNYKRAEPEVQNLYLRKSTPVCPYLKSSYSGFTCKIEFTEPFQIASDLPKCHIESAYLQHWQEKAPNVLEKAKKTTDRTALITYLNMLGKAKFDPSIPLMEEIFKTPMIKKEFYFIYENANTITISEAKEAFSKQFSQVQNAESSEEQIEENQLILAEFEKDLNELISFSILQLDGENIQKTELSSSDAFTAKWKLYSTPLIKQIALVALSNFENPELIPMFFDVFINSHDSKMIRLANNGLMRLKDYLEEPLLEYIDKDDIPSSKKSELIELAGKIKTDKMFQKLVQLSKSDDENLSYFAISSLGKFGERGLIAILDILQDNPTDLKLDSGRSTLATDPELGFKVIIEYLDTHAKFSEEFVQILSSILDEFDHSDIKKYFKAQTISEQDRIDLVFEKHNLIDRLDYLLG